MIKTQKIRPQLAAPVKRETVATISSNGNGNGNAIAPTAVPFSIGGLHGVHNWIPELPFAGDDAE